MYSGDDYFLKIDPYTETITAIPASDSVSYLCQHAGGRFISLIATQPHGDGAICNPDALNEPPYPPAWKFYGSTDLYFGNAVWAYVSEEGQMRTPLWSERNLSDRIEFVGFVEPRILVEYEPLEMIDPDDELDDREDDDTLF